MEELIAKDILDFVGEVMDNNSTSNYWLNKANIIRAYVKQAQTNAQQTLAGSEASPKPCRTCDGSRDWPLTLITSFKFCPMCGRDLRTASAS